ncbi:hypothetical protein N7466_006276 [Penicillium verhagenii]|uniref:uncharacterized protein n=1 Tax=Penicillium verhagenii TaxID=1562060 RepID=UPI0025454EE2|nr:uncharacterized protein N7466_006276 [Penicillium verhagenii]KAJ5930783.1 hypothetical protein N7466_006276 [Penicillium verhagenii]
MPPKKSDPATPEKNSEAPLPKTADEALQGLAPTQSRILLLAYLCCADDYQRLGATAGYQASTARVTFNLALRNLKKYKADDQVGGDAATTDAGATTMPAAEGSSAATPGSKPSKKPARTPTKKSTKDGAKANGSVKVPRKRKRVDQDNEENPVLDPRPQGFQVLEYAEDVDAGENEKQSVVGIEDDLSKVNVKKETSGDEV